MLSIQQKKAIIKFVTKVISYAKKIILSLLTNTTKHTRKNIKLVVSHGMKMNSLRKELLGKASYNLILIEPLNNQKTGMIFLIK